MCKKRIASSNPNKFQEMEQFFNEITLSVVIPVHNGGVNFRWCLSSIAAAIPPANEIIVVADADTDGSAQLAETFDVRVLRTPTRNGPASARNLGARIAQGDILFFVDADVAIPPDAIGQLKALFSRQPNIAAVFGSYDDKPTETNFISQYKNLFHHYIHQISNEEASTFWAGCGAIRRQIFLEIGGFDESYKKPSIEDIELGYRLKKTGYRVWLFRGLQAKHLKRWGIISLTKSDFFDRALPWTELILRDRQFVNDLNLRFSSRISVMLTYGFLLTLIGGLWWPGLFAVACALILSLLIINAPVYCFFMQKRGLWFMVRTLPWHWFYYFYCGLAFVIGLGQFFLWRHRSAQPSLSSAPKPLTDTTPSQECR
jgi:GT2 family glycosyltransferase